MISRAFENWRANLKLCFVFQNSCLNAENVHETELLQMASPRKKVQFQGAPSGENPLVIFNTGAVDQTRLRKFSRASSRMSMGSITLSEDEEESVDRDESVVS